MMDHINKSMRLSHFVHFEAAYSSFKDWETVINFITTETRMDGVSIFSVSKKTQIEMRIK